MKNLVHAVSTSQALLAAVSIVGVWLITRGLALLMRRLAARSTTRRELLLRLIPLMQMAVWLLGMYVIIAMLLESSTQSLITFSASAGMTQRFAKQGSTMMRSHSFRLVTQHRTSLLLLGLILSTLGAIDRVGVFASAMTSYQSDRPSSRRAQPPAAPAYQGEAHDREIAGLFAPVFYQGFGEGPRFDYITNFDFDGDWKGDNNWANSENPQYKLKAYVYYSVSETRTHYFVHYALFHPRDYKGGLKRGSILSELIREGAKLGGKYDPTGLSDEAVLAHENDLEGCLVVVEKRGENLDRARTVFVETLAHNRFIKYVPARSAARGYETAAMDGQRAQLFVEPKGHGIEAYTGDGKQLKDAVTGVRSYNYTGHADNPEKLRSGPVGYELLPIYTTLWAHARGGANDTYGEAHSYASITIRAILGDSGQSERQTRIGSYGSAFRGNVGAANMARPPWAWFDSTEKDQPLGEWFFDPVATIKRHFNLGDEFSTDYVHEPYLGVFRE